MFKLIAITLFTFNSSLANQIPLCSHYSVVLSPTPVSCIKNHNINFDIPELKLDFEDIGKIFEENKQKLGSESSGGRQVNPGSMSQHQPSNERDILLKCRLQVISDGGKSISYLSEQNLILTSRKLEIDLASNSFKHYLIKGNQFSNSKKYPVNRAPIFDLSQYSVNFKPSLNKVNKFEIGLCRKLKDSSKVCTVKTRLIKYLNRVTLKLQEKVKLTETYSFSKYLRLSCKKISKL